MMEASSRDILQMIEGFGLTGHWAWDITADAHYWSPGLYRLLGIPSGTVRPDYGRLFAMIHPDDCPAHMDPSNLVHACTLTSQTFRIVRADATVRTVISQGEVTVSPEGRPLRIKGVFINVSDREVLTQAQNLQGRRQRAIFERIGVFTSTTTVYPYRDFSSQWLELVGLPKDELVDEPTLPILRDERSHWREYGRELFLTKQVVHIEPHLTLASGAVVHYRLVLIPVLNAVGTVESWTNYVGPMAYPARAEGALRLGLEQRIEGTHLRAARALLDWSMTDLAKASGLSFAVVRRLEKLQENPGCPLLRRVIETLRQAGIVFSLMDGATIVVGKAR